MTASRPEGAKGACAMSGHVTECYWYDPSRRFRVPICRLCLDALMRQYKMWPQELKPWRLGVRPQNNQEHTRSKRSRPHDPLAARVMGKETVKCSKCGHREPRSLWSIAHLGNDDPRPGPEAPMSDPRFEHLTDLELIVMRADLKRLAMPEDADFLRDVEVEIRLRAPAPRPRHE